MEENKGNGASKVPRDFNDIPEYVKEFLAHNKYSTTIECFEAEWKSKQAALKPS